MFYIKDDVFVCHSSPDDDGDYNVFIVLEPLSWLARKRTPYSFRVSISSSRDGLRGALVLVGLEKIAL